MDTYKPTTAMANNAKRAKKMRDGQPKSNQGMTQTGLTRMNQLINREPLSLSTVKRMYSFFSRHEVDKKSAEWKAGNSKGEQGWLGWGGDAGYRWAKSIVNREEKAEDEMSARSTDRNGFVVIKGNNLTKVGVFDYMGFELPKKLGLDPNKLYKVHRPESVVSAQATIDSAKLVPWRDEHKMLGKAWDDSNSQADGIITDNVYYEAPYLKGDMKLFNSSLESKINDGKKDLSPGYATDYIVKSGVYDGQHYDIEQTFMEFNHIATVKTGRTGKDVSVLDSGSGIIYDEPCITFDSKELIMTTETKTVTLESLQASMDSMFELISEQAEKINTLQSAKDASYDKDKAKDKSKAKDEDEDDDDDDDDDEIRLSSKDKDKKEKPKGMDSAEVKTAMDSALNAQKQEFEAKLKSIADGQRLAKRFEKHIGAFDSAGMTLSEVAEYAAGKFEIACDSHHEIYVDARLTALESAPQVTTAQDSAVSENVLSVVNKY